MSEQTIAHGLPSDTGGKDLGVFLPIANGGWILSSNTPVLDASYAYNKRTAQLADQIGMDFIMSMAKLRGYGGRTNHWGVSLDSQILMAGLAECTKNAKLITTVHTLLQNPAVTAKMVATMDQISGGRAGLNIVSGSYKGEFEQMGAWRPDVNHDERYDLAAEWVQVIKRLWSEPRVDFDGKYFQMVDCESDPKPVSKPRPFLVCAGMSEKGMRFTVDHADAMFIGGRDDAELRATSLRAKELAAAAGRKIKTYAMVTLVMADSRAQADAMVEHYRAGFDEEAYKGMLRSYGFLDKEIGKENAFTARSRSSFMSANFVGSPDDVAERMIAQMSDCDLDGMMLIFPDYISGLEMLADKVMPQVRAAFAS